MINTSNMEVQNNQNIVGKAENVQNVRTNDTYGKTVGQPQLSEKAAEYYEELKKKYGNMDFILVSKDQIDNAKKMAASYANPFKPVVLIDEEKIEKMATDPEFRKKYEGIISGATTQLANMKQQLEATGASVNSFGMQVGDNGQVSFFANLKKSSEAQMQRIEKHKAEAKEEKKAEAKKEAKKEIEENLRKRVIEHGDKIEEECEDIVTMSAGSIDELIQKAGDFVQSERINTVRTNEEMMLGTHIDFKG